MLLLGTRWRAYDQLGLESTLQIETKLKCCAKHCTLAVFVRFEAIFQLSFQSAAGTKFDAWFYSRIPFH